jgi:hypothetical protein
MKQALLILVIIFFASGLVGCEQAQQALDAVDKAKSLKGDIEKKANEVKDKALGLVPRNTGKGKSEEEKKGGDGENENDKEEKDN